MKKCYFNGRKSKKTDPRWCQSFYNTSRLLLAQLLIHLIPEFLPNSRRIPGGKGRNFKDFLLHNSYWLYLFKMFVQDIYPISLFNTFVQDICSRRFFKTFVQDICSRRVFKTFVQDVCSRRLFKVFVQDFYSSRMSLKGILFEILLKTS